MQNMFKIELLKYQLLYTVLVNNKIKYKNVVYLKIANCRAQLSRGMFEISTKSVGASLNIFRLKSVCDV